MTALWIILAIALVLTALNLLPVGVDAAYTDETFSLADIFFYFFQFTLADVCHGVCLV